MMIILFGHCAHLIVCSNISLIILMFNSHQSWSHMSFIINIIRPWIIVSGQMLEFDLTGPVKCIYHNHMWDSLYPGNKNKHMTPLPVTSLSPVWRQAITETNVDLSLPLHLSTTLRKYESLNNIFIQQNAYKIIVCKISTILFQSQSIITTSIFLKISHLCLVDIRVSTHLQLGWHSILSSFTTIVIV